MDVGAGGHREAQGTLWSIDNNGTAVRRAGPYRSVGIRYDSLRRSGRFGVPHPYYTLLYVTGYVLVNS